MPAYSPELKEKYEAVLPLTDEFRHVIEQNIENTEGGVCASWEYLEIHLEMLRLLCPALAAKCAGDIETARARFAEYEKYVQHAEHRVYSVLDVFENLMMLRGVIERA